MLRIMSFAFRRSGVPLLVLSRRIMHFRFGRSLTGETAVTREDGWRLANHWVAAWNAHDLDLIMSHYDDAVELTSPIAAQLLGTPDGKVVGQVNLRNYFQRGLQAYPELHFQL